MYLTYGASSISEIVALGGRGGEGSVPSPTRNIFAKQKVNHRPIL